MHSVDIERAALLAYGFIHCLGFSVVHFLGVALLPLAGGIPYVTGTEMNRYVLEQGSGYIIDIMMQSMSTIADSSA
jgi:hypothetical protein